MALLTPLWMEAASGDPDIEYSAALDRAGLIGTVFSREGVYDKDAGDLRVSQRASGANMSVDVAAGRCAIVGDDVFDQGTYLCVSTTLENVTVPAAPPSGSRTHRMIARIKDKLHNGSWSTYEWTVELLVDTGSGTPETPNSAISLATVTVTSATTAITTSGNITDTRPRAVVGTPAITGALLEAGINTSYGDRDGTRPLTFQKNPDGWVLLSGWFRRSGGTTNLTANTTYWLDGAGGANAFLPTEARPSGTRDFIALTSSGFVHFAVYSSGALSFRFNYNTTLTQNQTWFSLDGCSFRANSF